MLKKCLSIGLAVMLLCSLGGAIGCGVGIYGTYVAQDNPEQYMELRRDGTFYTYDGNVGKAYTGKWEIEGNEIRLEQEGEGIKGRVEGNMLIFRVPGVYHEIIFVRE